MGDGAPNPANDYFVVTKRPKRQKKRWIWEIHRRSMPLGGKVLVGFAVAVAVFVLIGAAWWLLMNVRPRWDGVLPTTAHHRMQ